MVMKVKLCDVVVAVSVFVFEEQLQSVNSR
jgi:hypothetical protein